MKRLISTIIICISFVFSMMNAATIGQWKAYMAYSDITEIEQAGNVYYVLASKNIYSYNSNDNSIQTYDKINGLNACNISHIKWSNAAKRLIIIYENNNIDLLSENGNVTNIADYLNKTMTEDKTINSIFVSGSTAYVSTNFGIIKVDMKNAEIDETYNLGFRVDYSYIESNIIYAASSSNGLYSAPLTANLLNKANWTHCGNYVSRNNGVDAELLDKVKGANPGGPSYNYFYNTKFSNNKLYSCGGLYNAKKDLARPGIIQVLSGDEWTLHQDSLNKITNVLYWDIDCIDVDPTNSSRTFASGKSGLYEFNNGTFVKLHNSDNSPIGSALDDGNKGYQLIEGITFDSAGNLWCLNSQTKGSALLEYTKEGEWKTFSFPSLMNGNRSLGALQSPMFDSRGLLWFCNNHWDKASLHCFNPSTSEIKSYFSFVNEDGTTLNISEGVRNIDEDKSGNIWIATNVGPLELTSAEIYNGGETFYQVKVPRNDGTNYADYLLAGVDISCIFIDGGDRKWFGTNGNGVYVIDNDNITQIHHFTESNSELLSNYINSISSNEATGEVFFATENGLCSYMSDASTPNEEMTKDNVYAYPNPVKPDYTGLITVTGLTYDADVKIVTTNGALVAEGRSNGGTFTWDGNDANGRRVASGIYFVVTAMQDGSKGTVCKIAIIN